MNISIIKRSNGNCTILSYGFIISFLRSFIAFICIFYFSIYKIIFSKCFSIGIKLRIVVNYNNAITFTAHISAHTTNTSIASFTATKCCSNMHNVVFCGNINAITSNDYIFCNNNSAISFTGVVANVTANSHIRTTGSSKLRNKQFNLAIKGYVFLHGSRMNNNVIASSNSSTLANNNLSIIF